MKVTYIQEDDGVYHRCKCDITKFRCSCSRRAGQEVSDRMDRVDRTGRRGRSVTGREGRGQLSPNNMILPSATKMVEA